MARQKKGNVLDGPAGTKIKFANLKGGLGANLVTLDQTTLNLPQEEIDRELLVCREREKKYRGLLDLRIDDLMIDPEQRKYLKIIDIETCLTQLLQRKQVLAGYSSRSVSAEVSGTLQAIQELKAESDHVERLLNLMDSKIEEEKQKQLALPAPEVLDVIPEDAVRACASGPRDPSAAKPANKLTGRRKEMLVSMGYLNAMNEWTGKPLDDCPEWGRVLVECDIERKRLLALRAVAKAEEMYTKDEEKAWAENERRDKPLVYSGRGRPPKGWVRPPENTQEPVSP